MNNQAAQTMPELPESQYRGGNDVFGKEFPLYTADQMHQYARDYAAALSQTAGVPDGWSVRQSDAGEMFVAGPNGGGYFNRSGNLWQRTLYDLASAMLAAAPAASGGESAASVSERARDGKSVEQMARGILADAWEGRGQHFIAADLRTGGAVKLVWPDVAMAAISAALEQALTQQRGEAAAHASGVPGRVTDALVSTVEAAMHACYMDHDDYRLTTTLLHDMAVAAVKVVATTPQPSADAVRELVRRWRAKAKHHEIKGDRADVSADTSEWHKGMDEGVSDCADELESLLSAATDHQQNAAQGGGEK